MANIAVINPQVIAAPSDYKVPGAQELQPFSVTASYDGSGAAGAYFPCLQVLDGAGNVLFSCVPTNSVAAGVSADVSWFPGVTGGGQFIPTPGTGVPPAGNLDGYIFRKANVTVTGTDHTDRTGLLIQGNPIVLDGFTSIKVEFWCALLQIQNGVAFQAGEVELWDNFLSSNVDKGTIGIVENANASTLGGALYATVSLTPAAGTHTYSVYGYKNVAGSTVTFFANTFVDGTGNIAPMWYRITTIAFDNTLPS
jgi:hypothetical protein